MPPSESTIQQIGAEDLSLMNQLLDVFAEAFEDPAAYSGARPRPEYMRRLLGSDQFIALVAIRDEAVVGGLAAYELPKFEQERSEIYIYDLAVGAAHRRSGIATALISRLREIASARGAYVIFVQADLEDAPAIALYQSLGIQETVHHYDIAVPATPRSAGR